MLTQLLAWAATALGLWSTWLLGRRHCAGWATGIACSLLWIAVNIQVAVWAGIAQATINTALSLRAWRRWTENSLPQQPPSIITTKEYQNVPGD